MYKLSLKMSYLAETLKEEISFKLFWSISERDIPDASASLVKL